MHKERMTTTPLHLKCDGWFVGDFWRAVITLTCAVEAGFCWRNFSKRFESEPCPICQLFYSLEAELCLQTFPTVLKTNPACELFYNCLEAKACELF
jgi:hypothetical protein